MPNRKILIISTHEETFSKAEEELSAHAALKGDAAETLMLQGKQINLCTNCMCCAMTHHCVFPDDANSAIERIRNANIIIFSGSPEKLKPMMDRCRPLQFTDVQFTDVSFLPSSNDEENDEMTELVNEWIAEYREVSFIDPSDL